MTSRRAAIKQEQGVVMVLVIFGLVVVSLLAVYLIGQTTSEQSRSSTARARDAAFQAAEAGVNDYIAKLVQDSAYYLHRVHPGEATRRDTATATVVSAGDPTGSGTAWSYGLTWTYPSGYNQWRTLANGYQYSLQVVPPGPGSQTVTLYATGRPNGAVAKSEWRTVQVLIRPSSIADFQRIVDTNVSWGAGATTYGKLYANGTINHDGTAQASIYAKVSITGSVSMQNGAQKYSASTNPSFASQIPQPINFNNLLASIVDVQRAASLANYAFDDATKAAWRLIFATNGTFTVQSCTLSGGSAPEDVAPVCGAATTLAVPANGAIYTGQTAIVSGTVNGRVTVASNDDIVVANHIDYTDGGNGVYGSAGWAAHAANADDVLGLVAKNDVIVAAYAPATLNWTAAVLAQSGTWFGAGGSKGAGSVMNWTGSSTTKDGGAFSGQYSSRNYGYDPALLYLPPPWYPQIQDSYTTALFRELPHGAGA